MGSVRMALGCMSFGTRIDEESSFALLDHFAERGGRWLDTANCYAFWDHPSESGGQSEELLGRWLASRPSLAQDVLVSSKLGQDPTVPGSWPESAEGLSSAAVARAAEGILRRLRRDHVDLLWAHAEDRRTDLAETVEAFGALHTAGQAARLGASNHPAWRVERARRLATDRSVEGFSALQGRRSYLSPRPDVTLPEGGHRLMSRDDLDYAREESLETWFYSSLLWGSYVRSERPLQEHYEHPGTTRRLAALARVTRESGRTANQVVLAWLDTQGPAVRPIVGVSSIAQLDEALDAEDVVLAPEHLALLDAAS